MTTLLTFRDNIKTFLGQYDFVTVPLAKGIFSWIVLMIINSQMSYFSVLNNMILIFAVACVCAFLPMEMLAGIGFVFVVLHSFKVSIDVGILALILILFFYCAYMRFAPKSGVISLVIPMCYTLNLVYAIPIVLGMLFGPVAIVPAIFGVMLYYYQLSLVDVSNVLATLTEEDEGVQGYQYIIELFVNNKTILLIAVVFACVILVTFAIYRMSFSNSWIVAIIVGGVLNVVLFLVGSIVLLIEIKISSVLIGSAIGIFLSVFVQFIKGIVDYQRTEYVQFEDDNYYYYVKAVPKLTVSEMNKSVKRINSKTQN